MYKLTDEQIAEVRKLYPKKHTNFEKIRAMSVEELARWLCQYMECLSTCPKGCPGWQFCRNGGCKANGLIAWLESEVEE